ncbi:MULTISPECIES: hypothetical protein [unclassified Herbaspirillum]|uniref:hypothetical protein n=1 Tax=unclassified Herbaspirillum TaxID=2624150 RepID=UPI00114E022E|nr:MULTISPECIES: hypothetical protein [unclassified Herbaspirillum]MBB5391826.1 uncharacterized protein YejL (UPF0352 family) [Herbaspirillum sp. SJZ102]TQK02930.1 hypothetical protein FB599_3596 [Herbaspirillum sp. SJZ130]TQK06682.1 hypothetical protein FB598_3689 [Herbaspirillum sp. SJZ106]
MNHDDNSIPLLTEVIPLAPPQAGHPASAAAQPGAFWQPSAPAAHQAQPAPEMASPSAEQYRQWEQEISENVLQNLLAQADSVLQQHLQDQMAVVLDNISDILTQRVKESLRQALAETVTRAVAEEMARFSSSKN